MESPSRNLAFILILPTVIAFTIAFNKIDLILPSFNPSEGLKVACRIIGIILVIAVAALFSLRYPLDVWYYKKKPPLLDPRAVKILDTVFPFFRKMPIEEKQFFTKKMALFLLNTEVSLANNDDPENVPLDIETLVAQSAALFLYKTEKPIFKDLEKVIIYPGAFPTRENNEFHSCEFHTDGVIILSNAHMKAGANNPNQYFDVSTYILAEAYCHYENIGMIFNEDILGTLEEIKKTTKEKILEIHRLKELNINALAIETYINLPVTFKEKFPEEFNFLNTIIMHK